MSEASLDADQVKQYDRQIRLWGFAAQQKITQARVLVYGCRGMSAEIVKNLVLAGLPAASMCGCNLIEKFAGVGNVCLMDDGVAQEEDLGSQFLIPAECVGKVSRAEASIKSLQELNPKAAIRFETGESRILDEDLLKQFDLVCVTDAAQSVQQQVNALCRQHRIKFFSVNSHGFFACFFLDLNEHEYHVEKKEADTQKTTTETFQLSYPSLEKAMSVSWSKLTKGKAQVSKVFYALQLLHTMQERAGSASVPVENAEELQQGIDELSKRHSLAPACFEDDLFRKLAMQVRDRVGGGQLKMCGPGEPAREYGVLDRWRDGSGSYGESPHWKGEATAELLRLRWKRRFRRCAGPWFGGRCVDRDGLELVAREILSILVLGLRAVSDYLLPEKRVKLETTIGDLSP
eukprot:746806-Hanusia_phi.AAC.5